jgi:hypothetical protein
MAISLIEFVLEFYPVQAQGVQEAFHDIHAHEYCESGVGQLEKSYTNESCFHNLIKCRVPAVVPIPAAP